VARAVELGAPTRRAGRCDARPSACAPWPGAGARGAPRPARRWRRARDGSGRRRCGRAAARRGSPGGSRRRGRSRPPRSRREPRPAAPIASARWFAGRGRRAPRSRSGGPGRRRRWQGRDRGGGGPRRATAAAAGRSRAPRAGRPGRRTRGRPDNGWCAPRALPRRALRRRRRARPAWRGSARSLADSSWVSVNVRPQSLQRKRRLRHTNRVTRPAIGRSRTRTRGRSLTRTSLPPQWGQPTARASSSTCRSSCSPVRRTRSQQGHPTRRGG
jgi:hypothetical protein